MRRSFLWWILGLMVLCPLPIIGQPERPRVELSSTRVDQYGRLEIKVLGLKEYEQPGNTETIKLDTELKSPSGRTIVVPGFAMYETRRETGNGDPKFVPDGSQLWRVRFMPRDTGRYSGKVVVKTPAGVRRSDSFSFRVSPSESKGVIRVAKENPHAFEYEDGTPYIPIGQNLSWANGNRLKKYRRWLDQMAENGANYIRIWLGSTWCFGIQGEEPYRYNEDAARLMDEVLKLCEERGIAIKLCLGNKWKPYLDKNGGPFKGINSRDAFLTEERAKQQWKALQRYCVARFGASTSIMAWELWNEMGHTFGHEYLSDLISWTEEMGQHLHAVDPYDHLVTNSTGSNEKRFDLFGQPSIDFTQYHDYGGGRYPDQAQYDIYDDPLRDLRRLGKPVLLAECGLVDENWGNHPATDPGASPDHPKDRNGYAFHEGLWIGFFAGGAGTGMHWWWNMMTEEWGYYDQFAAFEKFVRDLPLNKEPLPPSDGTVSPDHLRCYVRQNSQRAIAWVVNENDHWRHLVMDGNEPERVSGARLTVSDLDDGKYEMRVMDPWSGEIIRRDTVKVENGDVTLSLPFFRVDTAVKMVRAE